MLSHMSPPTPPPDNDLTPQEHAALSPLLRLAQIGTGQDLVAQHAPAEVRRAELKRRFLEGLRESGTISKASAHAGISRRTASRWQQDDAEFAAEITRWLHEDQADELHETMFEITKRGLTDAKYASAAVKAGEFLLKSLDRDTYGDQLRTESTVTINQQVQVIHEVRDRMRAQQAETLARLQARTIDAPALEETPCPSPVPAL